nr:T9SS type A sorting domain-containing protein [uncultured Flavobacterium sp.]
MKKTTLLLTLLISGLASAQVTIGEGTRTDSNTGLSTPISIYYGYSMSQQIYTAEEINGSMRIDQLKFYTANQATALGNTANIDVWIGHTNLSGFQNVVSDTGAAWIPVTQQQRVMTSGALSFNGNEVILTLNSPFEYNGIDNIVITVDENQAGNNGTSYKFFQTVDYSEDVSLINRSDTDNPDPFNPPRKYTGPNSYLTSEVQGKKYKAILTLIGQNLGVNEFNTLGDAVLYPNPAYETVTINTPLTIDTVEVFDINGKNLSDNTNLSEQVLNISKLSTGVYLLKIKYKEGITSTKKIIKK